MLLSRSAARLAQFVERKALNLVVVGSSPTVGATFFLKLQEQCQQNIFKKRLRLQKQPFAVARGRMAKKTPQEVHQRIGRQVGDLFHINTSCFCPP